MPDVPDMPDVAEPDGRAGTGTPCRTGNSPTSAQAWSDALSGALEVLAAGDARGCEVTVTGTEPVTVLVRGARTFGYFDLPATQDALERLLGTLAPGALGFDADPGT